VTKHDVVPPELLRALETDGESLMFLSPARVDIRGPMSKEEKVQWDRWCTRIEECDSAIAIYTADLQDRKNRRCPHIIRDEIKHEKRIREIFVKAVGEPKEEKAMSWSIPSSSPSPPCPLIEESLCPASG
jgi:hypothetical protein